MKYLDIHFNEDGKICGILVTDQKTDYPVAHRFCEFNSDDNPEGGLFGDNFGYINPIEIAYKYGIDKSKEVIIAAFEAMMCSDVYIEAIYNEICNYNKEFAQQLFDEFTSMINRCREYCDLITKYYKEYNKN